MVLVILHFVQLPRKFRENSKYFWYFETEKMKTENTTFLPCGTNIYPPGLLDWASIGIISLARVARRAASDLSRVDMELPASSVSWPTRKTIFWETHLLQWNNLYIISSEPRWCLFHFIEVLNNYIYFFGYPIHRVSLHKH